MNILQNVILILLISLGLPEVHAQIDSTNNIGLEYSIVLDNNKVRINFLKPYIDSLNHLIDYQELPVFLLNYNFDIQNAGYWSSFHDPVSLRKMIFSQVTNEKVLNLILSSKIPEIHKKATFNSDQYPLKGNDIPYIDYSNLELAKMRLEELKQERNK